ncbi:Uncharacterised protein [Leclercia adecarboxylata]|nr:Uncharacterised protein [Leclercia adecarboxylata]
MFPLTPTLSQKRRGSRPCQYQERKPTGPIFLTEPPPESHVPPHPSPLPKEERGPTVPISGEEADRAHFLWGSLSPQKAACSPSPQPSHQRGEGAERANSRRGSRPCPFFVGIPQPTGRSHVPPHPNPLPKEERGPTVPISGEGGALCPYLNNPSKRSSTRIAL